jgi:hypothetical protein
MRTRRHCRGFPHWHDRERARAKLVMRGTARQVQAKSIAPRSRVDCWLTSIFRSCPFTTHMVTVLSLPWTRARGMFDDLRLIRAEGVTSRIPRVFPLRCISLARRLLGYCFRVGVASDLTTNRIRQHSHRADWKACPQPTNGCCLYFRRDWVF